MECLVDKTFERLLGKGALNGGSLGRLNSKNSNSIDFLVTQIKQQNYQKYCEKQTSFDDNYNPHDIINQYTEHTTELYAKVNLSLASDAKTLQTYGDYVQQLRNSVLSQPLYDNNCLLYRGVDLSDTELNEMQNLNCFYIPSFTSTSVDNQMAYSKSALMIIKLPYACKFACSITENLSNYYNEEREVLIACYSAFRLEKVEFVNRTKYVNLYLDEHLSSLPSLDILQYHSFN